MPGNGDVELDAKGNVTKVQKQSWWSCCSCLSGGKSSETERIGSQGGASELVTQVSQDQEAKAVNFTRAPRPPTNTNADGEPEEWLLPPITKANEGKKCLVLDLDETLVHSSFTPIPNADFVISLDLQGTIHRVYVRKRPGVDEFLEYVGEVFEVVVFTASLSKYADPLLDKLDPDEYIEHRLFREHCVHYQGNYVKDLAKLGRPLKDCIIVDNSPYSYMFQRDYSIPVVSWFNDKSDRQLYELVPFLKKLAVVDDVSVVLKKDRLTWSATPFDENV